MLAGYIVALFAYLFAACAGWSLIGAINHLDPPETAEAPAPTSVAAPRELRLAS